MTSPAKLLAAEQARCRQILESAIKTRQAAEAMVAMLNESLARAERALADGDRAEIVLAWQDLCAYSE